jgi:hypothetical protein
MFPYLSQNERAAQKDAINEFGIKYWTSNPVWVRFQEHRSSFYVNIEGKVWFWLKKYWLEKTDRATKTLLFDRDWAISFKPRRKSCPLRLVWWALYVFDYLFYSFRFDNIILIIVIIRRIFSRRTRSLVTLDSESLYQGKMHRKMLGRNK